jgi:hypothetical protein
VGTLEWHLGLADTFIAHTADNETGGPPLFSVGLNVGEPHEVTFLVITGRVGLLGALLLAAAFTRYLK